MTEQKVSGMGAQSSKDTRPRPQKARRTSELFGEALGLGRGSTQKRAMGEQ